MNNVTQAENAQSNVIELNDQDLTEVTGALGHIGGCCGIELETCCYGQFYHRFHFHHHHHVWWENDVCHIC
ncbi:hypothetical protein KDH_15700 [Dictyobacter sp. S3.2.2.5]|uniref:Bacteriocin n=1 Tax=Dictyobacter halimunensis TaxID=3026934 RepID=A0ABQ6FPJ2_9CHLR|nr:hypothetical protein KDH_15700 [Dictyobacter sp. S3.2.2.5]